MNKISKEELKYLRGIRQFLHSEPELANEEINTAAFLASELRKTDPDRLITNLGGYGLAAVYNGETDGKSILFRADMDGVPIEEKGNLPYSSKNKGISHSCGHDGHMAIALGLARYIGRIRKRLSGRVVVLFQPAEETAEGAKRVLEDPKFSGLEPDECYALHNFPGYPLHSIVMRDEVFANSSIGMIVRLHGHTSHAGEPEKGKNPAGAMCSIIDVLKELPKYCEPTSGFILSTVIHARLGEQAFGTSPGYAHVMATLRANFDKDLELMKKRAVGFVQKIAGDDRLEHKIEWIEYFPSTINANSCNSIIGKAAEELGCKVIEMEKPFVFSEDFSYFTQRFPSALFGLGSGESQPNVHNEYYDFTDELIETGVKIFIRIVKLSSGG